MFKSAAIAIVLVTNVHALNLNARTQGKHDFIKAMRKSQEVNGKLPRKLSNDKLIAKSVHKPGLRSSTTQTPEFTNTATESAGSVTGKSQEPIKRQLPTKRHLNKDWWKWWTSNNDLTDEETEEVENMNDDQLQDYMESQSSWWSWNGWGNSGNGTNATDVDAEGDDMWSSGENQTYVMESLADFSVKYAGCSSLTSYVDSDEEGSYPFVNQNFVSYRLCPSESCADDSWNGCKSAYGEYLMNLEDFLSVQQDYLDEEFEYYCTFCEQCIYFDTYFSENGQGCSQTDACYDYDDYCSDEARQQMEEEAEFSIEDFFECKEIDIWGNDDDGEANGDNATVVDDTIQFDDDRYNVFYKNEGKAYIGSHCNEGIITIGLFADDQCIHYVGNQIDFFNATGYELEASAVEEMYVPDGCLACDGNNIKVSGYWFPEDEREGEDYQNEQDEDTAYISEICYNMYSQSAKCHMHYGEDSSASEALELSDSEAASEQTTCDFIEDVVRGYVDDEGFVYSHQRENTNPIAGFLGMFGADDMETDVTAAQAAGLAITGVATAAMAFAAFQMKRKVDVKSLAGGLMANEAAVSS